MAIDLDELRSEIRRILATSNPKQYPLFKLLRHELAAFWKAKPRGTGFAKGSDPRRTKLVPEDTNKKPTN